MTDVNEQIPSYSFSFLHAFFSWSWVVLLLFFSFLFTPFFFFFSSSSLFGVWHFSLFFLIGVAFVLLVFGLFFSWSWVVSLLFFLLFFSRLPFFLGGVRCSSFFGAGHFPFSFWGAPNLFFVFLVSFPCFLFSRALCFLSLSLDRLNKPLRNRFLLVLSRFSDRLRGTMVTQSKTISWTICPSSGTKYDYVA